MLTLEFIPWLAMACTMALILILPLLSDGPPKPPQDDQERWQRGENRR
jgi:hypothetical protein